MQFIAAIIESGVTAAFAAGLFLTMMLWFSNSFLDVEDRIQRATTSPGTWVSAFQARLDAIYGQDLTGPRALAVSAVTSLALVLVGYAAIWSGLADGADRLSGDPGLPGTLAIALQVNVLPDFLSLIQTRWLLRRHVSGAAPRSVTLLIVIDLAISCAISLAAIWGFCLVVRYPIPAIVELLGLWSIFSVFFYSTFFSSMLMLGFGLGVLVIRLRHRLFAPERPLLTRDPTRQIAWTGAGAIWVIGFVVVLAFSTLLRGGDDDLPDLCRAWPDRICFHNARFEDDPARRVDLYLAGCEAEDPRSCAGLGQMYAEGTGVARDPEIARDLLARACSETGRWPCVVLARLYGDESWDGADPARAVDLLETTCGRGNPEACERLAWHLLSRPDPGDDARAAEMMQMACGKGRQSACLGESQLIQAGWIAGRDAAHARRLAQNSCQSGISDACMEYAMLLKEGVGGPADPAGAADLALQECVDESRLGCIRYALWVDWAALPMTGQVKAGRALKAACDAGVPDACKAPAILSLRAATGSDPDDPPPGLEAILEACRSGLAIACAAIGQYGAATGDMRAAFWGWANSCNAGLAEDCAPAALAWIRFTESGIDIAEPEVFAHLVETGCKTARSSRCLLSRHEGADIRIAGRVVRALHESGGPDTVERLLRDAARRFPTDLPISALSVSYSTAYGTLDEAITKANALVAQFPNDARTYAVLVRLRMAAAKPLPPTRELLQQGLALDATNLELLFHTASLNEADGRIDAAIDAYRRMLDLGASDILPINNFASLVLSYSDDPRDTARALLLSDRLDGHETWKIRETFGWATALKGDAERAARILAPLTDDAQGDPVALSHIGLALHWSGQQDAARPILDAALTGLHEPWHDKPRRQVQAAIAERP